MLNLKLQNGLFQLAQSNRSVLHIISSEFQARQSGSEVADADPGSSAAVFSLKQVDAVTVVEARNS